MNILEQIIQKKHQEVEIAQKHKPLEHLKESAFYNRKTLSLSKSIQTGSGIITEFKRQSPSKGIINAESKVEEVSRAYQKNGASGISILTDFPYFGGKQEDILKVRSQIEIPILRKDFMIDAYQFHEAKAMGADAVLLIAACLSPEKVEEFNHLAHELELEVLLELHSESELSHYIDAIDLVGINNRNLKDFKVDLEHSVSLKNQLPKNVISIAESGIYSLDNYNYLKSKGFDGFLMGEFFMKNSNPELAIKNFMQDISTNH